MSLTECMVSNKYDLCSSVVAYTSSAQHETGELASLITRVSGMLDADLEVANFTKAQAILPYFKGVFPKYSSPIVSSYVIFAAFSFSNSCS